MKCCSRSTLGVVIGALCIVCYIIATIYFIAQLDYSEDNKANQWDNTQEYRQRSIGITILMVVLVIMVLLIIISGIFIIGIVKRRHKLMLPWLFISGISFISHVTIFLAFLVRVLSQEFVGFLVLLLLGPFAIGLQALIWWVIYTLYRDIRMKSKGGNVRVIREPEVSHAQHTMAYPSQPNYYKQFEIRNDH